MVDFKHRSAEKELLDSDGISFEEIKKNMAELNTINRALGGHAITIAGIKQLLHSTETTKLVICEIGCGGGDNLASLVAYGKKKNLDIKGIGIDIKKECIDFARQQHPLSEIQWITNDYLASDLSTHKPDIVMSALFCHHFTDGELIEQVKWMRDNSRIGFLINDLERNAIAYYCISMLTSLFSRSRLVKNDARLSVARSFKRKDWVAILSAAGIRNYKIRWKWAFRYLITFQHV